MEAGEYEYLCILHTWMVATIVIEAPSEPTKVSIPEGTSVTGCEETNECYLPFEVSIDAGTLVSWSNDDTAAHTVTSGLKETGADGIFDSGLLPAGETFETAFNDPGSFDYYCVVHPWMMGTVNVE